MRHGFSLVELSIVLVILGLLVGGVLSGQSLIRAAEMRSLTTQLTQYQASVAGFRDKYFAMPGDMANATSFWGSDTPGICAGSGGSYDNVRKKETCNGDGNGSLSTLEIFRVYQHLADAGMIEGLYSGQAYSFAADSPTACGCYNFVSGINSPATRLAGVSFAAYNSDFNVGMSPLGAAWTLAAGNWFVIGKDDRDNNISGFMGATDAWNIDTKMDDGLPHSGAIRSPANNCAQTVSYPDTGRYAVETDYKECLILAKMSI